MHVLIVSQHFPPERGAVRRIYDFARYFVANGHKVTVLTAVPHYPDGIVPPKYRGRLFFEEEVDGVRVLRSWVLAASNKYPGRRKIGQMTFLVTALLNSLRIRESVDLVLATTPPVNTPVLGYLLSRMRRAKYLLEVRDLQPEASWDNGNLKKSLFTRLLQRVMHGIYRRADWVVTVTDGFTEYIRDLDNPPARVSTIKSGFSREFYDAHENGVRKKFGWRDKYLVLYAGTLGWAHHHESMIEAARRLVDQPDVLFVFVGDGERREELEEMVSAYHLRNVAFVGTQPLESIPQFLKASDVLVESRRDVPITRGLIPAKLFEYMASGRPIILGCGPGEAMNELDSAGQALAFNEDGDRLADIVLKLKTGEIDGNRLGREYRTYANEVHHRHIWAQQYLEIIEELVGIPHSELVRTPETVSARDSSQAPIA